MQKSAKVENYKCKNLEKIFLSINVEKKVEQEFRNVWLKSIHVFCRKQKSKSVEK